MTLSRNSCSTSKEYESSVSAETRWTDRLYNDSASLFLQLAGQRSDRWQPIARTMFIVASRRISLPVYLEKDSVDFHRVSYLFMKLGRCSTGKTGCEYRQYVLIRESARFFSGSSRSSISKPTSSAFETSNPIGSLRIDLLNDDLLVNVDLQGSIVAMTRLMKEKVEGGPNTSSSRSIVSFESESISIQASVVLFLRVSSDDHLLPEGLGWVECPTSESLFGAATGLPDKIALFGD